MTKKQQREGIKSELRVLWADPYIQARYAPQIHRIAVIAGDMHNRHLNQRRPNWAQPCTPALMGWLRFLYDTTNLATEQIAQMYNVNQARVSDAVIGVRT